MSDNLEANLNAVSISINAIEFALEAFELKKEETERINFLKSKVTEVPKLALYINFTIHELWTTRQQQEITRQQLTAIRLTELNIELEKERRQTAEIQAKAFQGE